MIILIVNIQDFEFMRFAALLFPAFLMPANVRADTSSTVKSATPAHDRKDREKCLKLAEQGDD